MKRAILTACLITAACVSTLALGAFLRPLLMCSAGCTGAR